MVRSQPIHLQKSNKHSLTYFLLIAAEIHVEKDNVSQNATVDKKGKDPNVASEIEADAKNDDKESSKGDGQGDLDDDDDGEDYAAEEKTTDEDPLDIYKTISLSILPELQKYATKEVSYLTQCIIRVLRRYDWTRTRILFLQLLLSFPDIVPLIRGRNLHLRAVESKPLSGCQLKAQLLECLVGILRKFGANLFCLLFICPEKPLRGASIKWFYIMY